MLSVEQLGYIIISSGLGKTITTDTCEIIAEFAVSLYYAAVLNLPLINLNLADLSCNKHEVRFDGDFDIDKCGVSFKSTKSFIQIEHNEQLNLGNGPCSISFAFRPRSNTLTGGIDKGDNAFYLLMTNKLGLRAGKSGAGTLCPSKSQLKINKYSHIVATKNGNDICLYINGKLDSTKTDNRICENNYNNLFIGQRPRYTNEGLVGTISFVALWNQCLTVDQVQSVYNDFKATISPLLLSQML